MNKTMAGMACAPNLGRRARRLRGRSGALLLAAGLAVTAALVIERRPPAAAILAAPLIGLGWTGIQQARRGL